MRHLFFLAAAGLLAQSPDYVAGMKALEAAKYEEAAGHFAKAAQAEPTDYAAYFHLGLSHSFLDKHAEAEAAYRKTLELKPGLYEAELNLGVVLLAARKPADAVPLLKSAAEKKPREFRPNFYLAESLRETARPAEAEPVYRAAAEIDPKSAPVQFGLGRTFAALNRVDEAGAAYKRAAQLDPSFRDTLFEMAATYEAAKRNAEAIELYALFPDNATARERMGALQIGTGDNAGAIASLEQAVKLQPDAANRYALATAYLRAKQPEKAAMQIEQALALEPKNLDLRMMYGRLLRDQRKFDPAARHFFAVTQLKPDSLEAWKELSAMLISLENYPQALAAIDRTLALGERSASIHFFRALVLDHMKQYKLAKPDYEKFLAMSQNQFPDEEFKARQRLRVIEKELNRR
ncbi:MAG: tetratricopeptide repeat protein [Acidobacteria bacterium]|nr:tetratricopeptide repeat protein [Acidobacteriota bacterium]